MRARAREAVNDATAESLMETLTTDDPILRREGTIVLLDRLANGEAELAVVGTRVLARAARQRAGAVLEDLLYVAFDVVRASLFLPIPYHHAVLEAFGERTKPIQALTFCKRVEQAQRAAERYAPLEAVLLSLFLDARRLTDG